MDSVYTITTTCLQILDTWDMAPAHKGLIKGNMIEIQKHLQDDMFIVVKCEFFGRERFENLLAEMQDLSKQPLRTADINPLVGGTDAILKFIKQ